MGDINDKNLRSRYLQFVALNFGGDLERAATFAHNMTLRPWRDGDWVDPWTEDGVRPF